MTRALLCLALLAGCTHDPQASLPLIVGVAPSLRSPFEAIVDAWKTRNPTPGASLAFGSAAELLASGAPVDLVCADADAGLAALGARATERRYFGSNPIVLAVHGQPPPGKELTIKTLADGGARKIALGDSRSDATGAAAEAALGRLGLRRGLDGKLLYTAGGAATLEKVARGEADAALVLSSDLVVWNVAHPADPLIATDRLAEDTRTRFPVALVAGTPRAAAARRFVEDLVSGEGRRLLDAQGYLLPPSRAP